MAIRGLLTALLVFGLALAAPARAQTAADAEAAVMVWLNAIKSGDAARISAILAPEFQIQRADGTGFDRVGYLTGFAIITEIIAVSDVVVTAAGDIMVVRYQLRLTSTVDGRPTEALAPRLTVFRREGDVWLVVAHANFARLAQ